MDDLYRALALSERTERLGPGSQLAAFPGLLRSRSWLASRLARPCAAVQRLVRASFEQPRTEVGGSTSQR